MSAKPDTSVSTSRGASPYPAILAVIVLALILFGLVMYYSTSFPDSIAAGKNPLAAMRMQFFSAVLGVLVAVAIWRIIPMRLLSGNLAYIIWIGCLLLCVITMFIRTETSEIMGARRWLIIGPLSLQPSELMKIAVCILCAKAIADYRRGDLEFWPAVGLFAVSAGIPLAIILVGQTDLGTTLICAVGILAVILLGGIRFRVLIPAVILGGAAVVWAVAGTPFRRARLAVWLDPWVDPLGDGYQLIHAYYALAEGGMFGVGLGQSHEKFQYLPYAQNDFIFAVIGEELGLVGAALVVLLFFALLVAGLHIAFSCRDDFAKMVAGSMVLMVVAQAFLNICCVIGILPVTGKPLPFFSQGGTALLVACICMGLVLAASRDPDCQDLYAKRRGNLRLVTNVGSGSSAKRR